MLYKVAVLLSFYSRKITNIIFGVYLVLIVFLNESIYNNQLPNIYLNIFCFILGLFIGINLMVWIVRFLSKQNITESNISQKIRNKSKKNQTS